MSSSRPFISIPQETSAGIRCILRRYIGYYIIIFFLLDILIFVLLTHFGELGMLNISEFEKKLISSIISVVFVYILYLPNLSYIQGLLMKNIFLIKQAIQRNRSQESGQILVPEISCDDSLYDIVQTIKGRENQITQYLCSLQDIIGYIQHEINTPLTISKLEIEKLKSTQEYDATAIDSLAHEIDRIAVTTRAMTDLIDPAKDYNEQYSNVSIYGIVGEIMKQLERTYENKRLTILGDISFTVCTHAPFAYIILKNLLENAVDHGSNHVSLTIDTIHNRIIIVDTGPGIEKRNMEFVRLPFWKEKSSAGQGLGLSLVKRLCDELEWKIIMHSSPSGTRFTLQLP